MLCVIPNVKKASLLDGHLMRKAVCYTGGAIDHRILAAVEKLPCDQAGVPLTITVTGESGESYTLDISENSISIVSEGNAGAFYAVQTLRQLFCQETVPCVHIEDKPDFPYRGFYHDVTRGKIPTLETLKQLIDQMAYYKLNSLQLYVEHTYEFEEYKDLHHATGCLTRKELLELGAYCQENFIDFIPSLSTFGHLYELLELPRFKHLRVLKDYEKEPNFWANRMLHHTLDPENDESIALVKSLVDQYVPCFESNWFNICCDETFDLHTYDTKGIDSGKLYVDFVKKIISHVQSHGKQVMMWADILLKYPETIPELPADIAFLNWNYSANPEEEKIAHFARSGRKQIVCPGTTTWSRLCECVDIEEKNVCLMAEYGYRHGALGVLNTNWGDFANPCSIELAMYGLVLGAEKSWTVATQPDDAFYSRVNTLLYNNPDGVACLKALSRLHDLVSWDSFCWTYFNHRYGQTPRAKIENPNIAEAQKAYTALAEKLSSAKWSNDEFRQEMLLAAEGICVMAELWAKVLNIPCKRLTDTKQWLKKYEAKWLAKNQPNELYRIQEMFTYYEEL